MVFLNKSLILVTFLFVFYFAYAEKNKEVKKINEEELKQRIKELNDNGSLPAFFKNLKYPSFVDEGIKDLEKINLFNRKEVRNPFFEGKINETLECVKLALKKGNPETGRPPMDPWTPNPFPLKLNLGNYLWTDLNLSNVRVENHLDIQTVKLTLSSSYVQETEFLIPKVVVSANYDGSFLAFNLLRGQGKSVLRTELTNAVIKSKLQYNTASPPLVLSNSYTGSVEKTLISISGLHEDEDINKWANEFLNKATHKVLNQELDKILNTVAPVFIDRLNNHFGDVTLLDFLAKLANYECKHKDF